MSEPEPESEPPAAEEAAAAPAPSEGGDEDDVDDAELEKAQKLMNRILETQLNPNPKLIHSLASLLESHEARYLKESNSSLSNNAKSSHTIGKLANLIRDNDDFFELVFSKFLSDNRCPVSVSSACARLLIICSSGWLFPHVFEDAVVDNIKRWVVDDVATSGTRNDSNWKHLGKNKPTDTELLRTYSIGLLAIALNGGGPVVEESLTLGVSAKLMHFLRVRVLGDATSSHKDNSTLPTSGVSLRVKDDTRGKSRIGDPVSDKGTIPRLLGDANGDLLRSELTDSSPEIAASYDISEENGDATNNLEVLEGKGQLADENSPRIRKGKNRGKGKAGEGILGHERTLMSPGSNRGLRDRSTKGEEANKKNFDSKRILSSVDSNAGSVCGESNDERLKDCLIGSKDISEIVLRAIGAAESEARAAGAPYEAIKAAGDAAAELVKSAALEIWKNNNDEDAALAAANEAASTVVDAAMSTDVSRSDQPNTMPEEPKPEDTSEDATLEDFTIPDLEPLCQLREMYSIQCLQTLGEYVEALGPILHEKGVDVCLALLQRTMKDQDAVALLLPEVLKLINALGAHKKFAALFVDRGGIQKLLEVRRLPQTFVGLSLCLFTIGSLQGIMERVSALPPDVVNRVVELALQLLECQQDQARKNSAIFFASAFVFRAILDSFDSKEGLQKFLSILQNVASVRSGGGTATPNPNPEVLTTSEKQIAYHTCVALRQYFRAHLLLLVDYLRPNKGARGGARSGSGARAAYKPLDISSEAIDAVFVQIQKDRKLGTNLVRARWPVVDRFLTLNGHNTMLELCQAPPVERYLHDLAQYAFGILHIVTFVPCTRKLIVTAQLSNNRVGMAIILDAANAVGYVDPEVIRPALNVLINLVCPPPSISNKPSAIPSGSNAPSVSLPTSDKSTLNPSNTNATASTPATTSAMVGDRRITLGSGAGCAGLAAQLEQGYRQAREAVRANNGIKVLLNLLNSRMIMPPGTVESIRALACRVLLGLAIDDTIAHILAKLQVGKKLSELIRDSTGQPSGGDQGRWQKELTNVAIELIAILTNSGKATTLAATDAAAPALRRIERAAIAAATPISYHSRELLQLIHEHLQASGLKSTADTLLKETDITPLPSSGNGSGPPLPLHQTSLQEPPSLPIQWPSSRTNCSFLQEASKSLTADDEITFKRSDSALKRKPLVFCSNTKSNAALKPTDSASVSAPDSIADMEAQLKSPIVLPLKRNFNESKDSLSGTPTVKRLATADLVSYQSPLCQTPGPTRRPTDAPSILSPTSLTLSGRANFNSIPVDNLDDVNYIPGIPGALTTSTTTHSHLVPTSTDQQPGNSERMTLDSLVVQYLKHQHRQCPAPITTLPPLSLLQPHVCPEPSRAFGAPTNVTARMAAREIKKQFSAAHCPRRDRQFIYSRFRPCRTCRDDVTLLTCMTFLGDSLRIATGNHSGELKIFDCNTGNMLESHSAHQTHVTLVQSANQFVLSSTLYEVRLWDTYNMPGGPLHSFDGCKAARFSHSGARFAALSVDQAQKEVLLYDVQTGNMELRLPDNGLASRAGGGSGRSHAPSLIHFSPCDDMLLWNGILWDRRSASAVHRFDQFTDYGGGGFHPSGNEVILNSEVWDLRKFKLLRSVPLLDQTVITFSGAGDVIYAILRRNLEDVSSAIHTRRVRHPLFPAFRTIDSFSYSEIATVQVDRCVLDLAVDPTDSLVGVVAMDDHEEMFSSARLYEVGRRRAADDDSDPDDGGETEEEESDDEESDGDVVNAMLDMAAAAEDSDDILSESDNDEDLDDLDSDSENDDGDYNDVEGLGLGAHLLDMMADGGDEDDGDDDSDVASISSDDEFV